MLVTRYHYAAELSAGKDVLEVACGSGQGLGYLARRARSVVAGDFTAQMLAAARRHYGTRIPFVRLDAQHLPFETASFDTVVLHEAIYYLASPRLFVAECARVLRPNGVLVISAVNCEWQEFNRSPMSNWYPTSRELRGLLDTHFERTEILGAFRAQATKPIRALVALTRRAAVKLDLIPKTMRSKALLKWVFYGALVHVPSEVTPDLAPFVEPVPLNGHSVCRDYKMLLVVARCPAK